MIINAMRQILSLIICLVCLNAARADTHIAAERFIDAFYSFDAARLTPLIEPGADAQAVLYYQAWARAAHYEILQRQPCKILPAGDASCAITVTDDFGTTLGYTATDTFYLTFSDDIISSARFEGDDPLIFYLLYAWIAVMKPEVLSGPCDRMFEGGETPAECASAIAASAKEFMGWWPFGGGQ